MSGLVSIVLGKEWLGNHPGTEVKVDESRGAWLRANGFEARTLAPLRARAVPSKTEDSEAAAAPEAEEAVNG